MDNDNNVNVDTSNDTTDDVTVDSNLEAEERMQKLEEQNKKLYERAKKAEGFVKLPDGSWVKKETKTESAPKAELAREAAPKPSDILKADEFKLYRQGYTEEEIDIIMRNGGMKILENDKSPIVLGLKASKEQRRAEEAASQASTSSGVSDIEKKYTIDQLKKMSVKELEEILPKA